MVNVDDFYVMIFFMAGSCMVVDMDTQMDLDRNYSNFVASFYSTVVVVEFHYLFISFSFPIPKTFYQISTIIYSS